jgi:hypothetical protein
MPTNKKTVALQIPLPDIMLITEQRFDVNVVFIGHMLILICLLALARRMIGVWLVFFTYPKTWGFA